VAVFSRSYSILSLLTIRAGNFWTWCFSIRRFSEVRSWSTAIGSRSVSWFSVLISRSIFDQTFCIAFISVFSFSYS